MTISLEAHLMRGTSWMVVGALLSRALSVVGAMLVARQIGRESYGEFGMVQSTVLNMAVFTGYGLGVTATKHLAEYRHSDPERAGRIAGVATGAAALASLAMAVSLAVLSPWVAATLLAEPNLAGLLLLGSVILLFNVLTSVETGILQGLQAFSTSAKLSVITGTTTFISLVFGATFAGLWGAMVGLLLGALVAWIIVRTGARKETARAGISVSLAGASRELSVLARFSMPAIASAMLYGPVNFACLALLANQPNGYNEVAAYTAANQWFALVVFVPGIAAQVLLPMLVDASSGGDVACPHRLLRNVLLANIAIAVSFILLITMTSPWIMRFYGSDFAGESLVLITVASTGTLVVIQNVLSQSLTAASRLWSLFLVNIVWAVVFIGSSALLVNYGAEGLALGRALAYLVILPLLAILVMRGIRHPRACSQ